MSTKNYCLRLSVTRPNLHTPFNQIHENGDAYGGEYTEDAKFVFSYIPKMLEEGKATRDYSLSSDGLTVTTILRFKDEESLNKLRGLDVKAKTENDSIVKIDYEFYEEIVDDA